MAPPLGEAFDDGRAYPDVSPVSESMGRVVRDLLRRRTTMHTKRALAVAKHALEGVAAVKTEQQPEQALERVRARLALCAVLSQMKRHEEAWMHASDAVKDAEEILNLSPSCWEMVQRPTGFDEEASDCIRMARRSLAIESTFIGAPLPVDFEAENLLELPWDRTRPMLGTSLSAGQLMESDSTPAMNRTSSCGALPQLSPSSSSFSPSHVAAARAKAAQSRKEADILAKGYLGPGAAVMWHHTRLPALPDADGPESQAETSMAVCSRPMSTCSRPKSTEIALQETLVNAGSRPHSSQLSVPSLDPTWQTCWAPADSGSALAVSSKETRMTAHQEMARTMFAPCRRRHALRQRRGLDNEDPFEYWRTNYVNPESKLDSGLDHAVKSSMWQLRRQKSNLRLRLGELGKSKEDQEALHDMRVFFTATAVGQKSVHANYMAKLAKTQSMIKSTSDTTVGEAERRGQSRAKPTKQLSLKEVAAGLEKSQSGVLKAADDADGKKKKISAADLSSFKSQFAALRSHAHERAEFQATTEMKGVDEDASSLLNRGAAHASDAFR